MNTKSAIEAGIEGAKRLRMNGIRHMEKEEGVKKSLGLLERSETAMVGSNDESGHPHIKAMFKIESDGLKTIWFSTNTSSKRVAQFKQNPKASLYFYDAGQIAGLLLVGNMEVQLDAEIKERLWRDGWEAYYPLGVTDPDYCVLRFTALRGNYYQGLQNITFEI